MYQIQIALLTVLLFFASNGVGEAQHSDTTNLPQDLITVSEAEQHQLKEVFSKLRYRLVDGDTMAFAQAIEMLDDARGYQEETYFGPELRAVRDVARDIILSDSDFVGISKTDTISASELANYLKAHKSKISFSTLLGRFSDQAITERSLKYRLRNRAPGRTDKISRLEAFKAQMAAAEAREDWFAHVQLVPRIGEIGTPAAFAYLKECAAGAHWGQGRSNRDKQIREALQNALGYFSTLEAASLILDLAEELDGWGGPHFAGHMAKSINVYIGHYQSPPDSVIRAYRQLLDSLPSIPALREMGYQQVSDLREEDFADRSDYLVYLIRNNRHALWVQSHALEELVERRDPVVLRELAGGINRMMTLLSSNFRFRPYTMLHDLTTTAVEIQQGQQQWEYALTAGNGRDGAIYWAQHYQEYEWSEAAGLFVYSGTDALPEDTIVRLFNTLFYADERQALEAFFQLLNFTPEELESRARPYHLFSATTLVIPKEASPFYHRNLRTNLREFARLNAFCRSAELPIATPNRFDAWLPAIDRAGKEEEQLAEALQLEQLLSPDVVTGLELYTIGRQELYPRAYTIIGSLLETWYASRWSDILADTAALRLYLKKYGLYPQMVPGRNWGGFGTRLSRVDDQTLAALQALLLTESDQDIRTLVEQILLQEEVHRKESFTVPEFLDYSKLGQNIDPRRVQIDTSAAGLKELFALLPGADEVQLSALLRLIDLHKSKRMTPYLLVLVDDLRVLSKENVSWRGPEGRRTIHYNILLGDIMVGMLEQLYDHRFPIEREAPWTEALAFSRGKMMAYWDKHLKAEDWRRWLATKGGR